MFLRKIIKLLLVFSIISFLTLTGLLFYTANEYQPTVAEYIMDSVVIVENSSGVVVYQDEEYSLVLTAAHVVRKDIPEKEEPILVKIFAINDAGEFDLIPYEVEDYEINDDLDLAILKLPALDETIIPAQIVKENPKIGDEIYVGANPHYHYRSIKKGILSSKFRINRAGINTWEVDAMIIFGSSGGGAFTKDGKLFGIVSGIDALQTDHCWGIIDLEGKSSAQCLSLPMTEIGYIVTPNNIRKFISTSKFADYFDL